MELSEFQIRLHILFHLITKPFKAVETCLKIEVSHVKYLLDNCFFLKFGAKIHQQIAEILMGLDPATFTTNLFLYYYEDRLSRKTKKKELITARRFVNVFHFIDYLVGINDRGKFEKASLPEIYPPELELEKGKTLFYKKLWSRVISESF